MTKSTYTLLFVLFSGLGRTMANIPFPMFRTKEVKFAGGVAEATGFHSAHWRPERAFVRQVAEENGWHTKTEDKSTPVSIWYDFKTIKIRPDQVSLQPAQKGAVQGAPSAFQFIGSNADVCDDFAEWTILCEDLSDKPWRGLWETRYCKVGPEVTEKFRCLGIRALKNHRPDGWTSLRNIRMWERIEDPREEL